MLPESKHTIYKSHYAHVIARVVSIYKFLGSFLNLFIRLLPRSLKKYYSLPFFNENKCCYRLCIKVTFSCFAKFEPTRVKGRGPNIVIFCKGRQNKTFKLSSKFFPNGRLIDLSVDIFYETSSLSVMF